MRKLLTILPVLFAFAIISPVLAQDRNEGSAFGNLTDERNTNRTILETRGVRLQDYRNVREDYQSLRESHETSFGTRREELADQMLGRAKDILIAKLGATASHLESVYSQLADSGRASEAALTALTEAIQNFNTKIAGFETQINEAESLEELRSISAQINSEVQAIVNRTRSQNANLNVARGEHLIGRIEARAEVIQRHINAAADLGGDVTAIQRAYDSSMLSLEAAKDEYAEINVLISGGEELTSSQIVTLRSLVNSANKNLKSAFEGLQQVVKDLRVLYSQSPWEI